MQDLVVLFEVAGGRDKNASGNRADSVPLISAFGSKGVHGEILHYSPAEERNLLDQYLGRVSIVLSRINPGDLAEIDTYWKFLNKFEQGGAIVETRPEVMRVLSFKDLIYKLRDSPFSSEATDFYPSLEAMRNRLPLSLMTGPRVLKRNFTSTGVGVWKLELLKGEQIACTEAADNASQIFADFAALFRFLEPNFFGEIADKSSYFAGREGLLDVPFLPGIRDGEVRVFFVHEDPVYVLHKKPQEDSFSAALFSGAHYTADERLSRWQPVIDFSLWGLRRIKEELHGLDLPVIWSMDSIPAGNDQYVLSDINAAAVGFSSPSIVDSISNRIAQKLCERLIVEK
ncbi:MAG: Cj0069 family protein [Pseudomonadota bacterium]